MNPQLIALILEKNGSDVKAILAKIGLDTLIDIMPNVIAIMQTVSAEKPV